MLHCHHLYIVLLLFPPFSLLPYTTPFPSFFSRCLLACNLFTFVVPLCSLTVRFIRRTRREKARKDGKLIELNRNSNETNNGGQIGGVNLFELSQSDYRGKMPIGCPLEASINTKFKDYLNREVQKVWKVINRRQVICLFLPFPPFPFSSLPFPFLSLPLSFPYLSPFTSLPILYFSFPFPSVPFPPFASL